jgi:hypothetical protein
MPVAYARNLVIKSDFLVLDLRLAAALAELAGPRATNKG